MFGFNVSEAGHVVSVISPQNITGGVTGQAFYMKRHKHVSIIIQLGAQAAAFTKILLNLCSSAAGAGATAIPFNYYSQTTAGNSNDVLSALLTSTAAGVTPTGNANTFYVIEMDANELEAASVGLGESGDFAYLQLQLTNGANADFVSAVAVLSGARDAEVSSPTVCV